MLVLDKVRLVFMFLHIWIDLVLLVIAIHFQIAN